MRKLHAATPPTRHSATAFPRPRRGAAYLLVLSAGMLLTVIGFGILASSRSTSVAAGQSADIDEATVLAESAVEQALAVISNNSNWRTLYTSGVEGTAVSMGRGTMSIKLVDETDGNLSNNTSDGVRVYGIGRVGSATRSYSVKLSGSGAALDILKAPAHSGGNITVSSAVTVTGGPLSTNGTLTANAVVTGDAQASTFAGSSSVSGTKTTLGSTLSMPSSTTFDTYKAMATEILFSSIASGTVNQKVITSTSNPFGTASASGVYYVHVPSTGTLTIRNSRLLATLVVELDAGGKIATSSSFAWDPPRTDYPTLIVKGTTGTVTLAGSATALNEATNLIDFNGDGDMTDTYPSELHGLVHVIGSSLTTSMTTSFNLRGAAIVEGNLTIGLSNVKLNADSALYSNPPTGYSTSSTMTPDGASWRWEHN